MSVVDPERIPTIEDFPVQVFRLGDTIAIQGPTWQFSPKVTFQQFLTKYSREPLAAMRDIASEPPKQDSGFGTKLYPASHILEASANRDRFHPLRDDLSFEEFFRPRFANYHLRFDLAESHDSAGMAMVHHDYKTGRIVADLLLEIQPPKQGEIRLQALERLVYSIIARGFRITCVSFDQAHSSQFRQNLIARGIHAEKLSVDRTVEPHETLFNLIHSGVLDYYPYPPLVANLDALYLLPGGTKIDHAPHGAKDVADALAGACHTLIRDEGIREGDPEIVPLEDPKEPDAEKKDETAPEENGMLSENIPQETVKDDPAGEDPFDPAELDEDDDGTAF